MYNILHTCTCILAYNAQTIDFALHNEIIIFVMLYSPHYIGKFLKNKVSAQTGAKIHTTRTVHHALALSVYLRSLSSPLLNSYTTIFSGNWTWRGDEVAIVTKDSIYTCTFVQCSCP